MKESEEQKREAAVSKKVAIGMAFGTVVLRQQKLRRNVLFGLTLLTLVLVFGGAVFLGDGLMKNPAAFVIFWGLCFLLVGLVLMLALYDMLAVRREHRQRLKELEKQVAAVAKEAREEAARQKKVTEKYPEAF